jgi:DNA polymerase-3 subunit alpha
VVFPEAFKQCGHLTENGRLVVVKGRFERDDESARLLAEEISPIELVSEKLATSVAIRVSTPPHGRATFERLWDVLAQHKGDRCVAFDIELQQPDRRLRVRVDVNAQIRVRPSEGLVSDVEKICGAGSVVIGRAVSRAARH